MSLLLDFVDPVITRKKNGEVVVSPSFNTIQHEDIINYGDYAAVWDAANEMWTTDQDRYLSLIDDVLREAANELGEPCSIELLGRYGMRNAPFDRFKRYCSSLPIPLYAMDQKVTFKSDRRKRNDFCSKRLSYDMNEDVPSMYLELVTTLYSEEELQKFEWYMGSIISGDFPKIQKFIAITGLPGTGKSTLLNIVETVLGDYSTRDSSGYVGVFSARDLTNVNNRFGLSPLSGSPIIAIDHDADLSRITDNTRLNSVVSHECQTIDIKGVKQFSQVINTMLIVASNKDVRITDSKAGILRRLIDISPSGKMLSYEKYEECMHGIAFEKGAICNRWLQVYNRVGRNAYDRYIPESMLVKTNDIHLFVLENLDYLNNDGKAINSRLVWDCYKGWCEDRGISEKDRVKYSAFHEEMSNYYENVYSNNSTPQEYAPKNGRTWRMYQGLNLGRFKSEVRARGSKVNEALLPDWLNMDSVESRFDSEYGDLKAQYTKRGPDDPTGDGGPKARWKNCKTTLDDIDTSKLHYVRPPANMVVIDFDLKNSKNEKDKMANLQAAAEWPATYAEFSKSGSGLHLHYFYDGDLSDVADQVPGGKPIDIKKFPATSQSALRRMLSLCNDQPIATIRELPLDQKKMKKVNKGKVLDEHEFKDEAHLRNHIENCLRRKYEPHTKPNVDYIRNALMSARRKGIKYDLTDLSSDIFQFAASSSHQADYCMQLYNDEIKPILTSKEPFEGAPDKKGGPLVFFDVEVFPNLFVICFKTEDKPKVHSLVNPTAEEVRQLTRMKLVGFNNRRYDNHILYAACIEGTGPDDLYEISQRIINNRGNDGPNPFFGQAYDLAYADILDFSSKKQSLKKFEIELGIHHQELDLPWDKPVPERLWDKVVQYCKNDVRATEATFKARHGDFIAREILAEISGLKVCNTTRQHATKIIFGDNKYPQSEFVYTHLNEMFPGYEFDNGKSTYMGEVVGEGGYVYAEPGMYGDVTVLDVASMHPTSIIELNLFGDYYTQKFKEIVDLRLAIKHGDFKKARTMMGGKVAKYLDDESQASDLANALKIVINSIYGFTAARFDCEFRDPRNVDNIVAKRGALFMINLKNEVQRKGFPVAHIKTDSIKIPNATPEIIEFVEEYGKKYGYTFEIENEFDRFCLVNDAVYIARHKDGKWDATGAEFQVPYVFKTLFTHEDVTFDDLCVTKSVSNNAAIYLDMNEGLDEDIHSYKFVGRTGQFCPVKEGSGGGLLLRKPEGEERYGALAGTKGWRWFESEEIRLLKGEGIVDVGYFEKMAEEATESIEKYGDFSKFVKE